MVESLPEVSAGWGLFETVRSHLLNFRQRTRIKLDWIDDCPHNGDNCVQPSVTVKLLIRRVSDRKRSSSARGNRERTRRKYCPCLGR